MTKSPAFQYYAADFLADENTAVMTAEEIGVYHLLMLYCWREGRLDDDMSKLSRLARICQSKFEKMWNSKIKKCFAKRRKFWVHPRLEKEREKQKLRSLERSESGKRGAASRWDKQSHSSAIQEPMANDGSSSSTSSSTSVINIPPNPPLQGGQEKPKRLTRAERRRLERAGASAPAPPRANCACGWGGYLADADEDAKENLICPKCSILLQEAKQ